MSEYNVLINKYDALNAGYDQLYPKPMKHANTHASGGTDPITPADIGAYSKTEADALLANKAPSGYGYGETLQQIGRANISEDDFVTALDAVYAAMQDNTVKQVRIFDHPTLDGGIHFGQLWRSGSDYGALIVYSYYNFKTAPIIRVKNNNVWQPWEYVNPPMELGVEYRTTERHCGKPVYKQLFSLGALSSTTGKTEYYPFGEGESAGAHGVISADAYVTNTPGGNGGWHTVLPSFDISGKLTALATFNGTKIELYTAANWTGFYGFVYLKYTKPWED